MSPLVIYHLRMIGHHWALFSFLLCASIGLLSVQTAVQENAASNPQHPLPDKELEREQTNSMCGDDDDDDDEDTAGDPPASLPPLVQRAAAAAFFFRDCPAGAQKRTSSGRTRAASRADQPAARRPHLPQRGPQEDPAPPDRLESPRTARPTGGGPSTAAPCPSRAASERRRKQQQLPRRHLPRAPQKQPSPCPPPASATRARAPSRGPVSYPTRRRRRRAPGTEGAAAEAPPRPFPGAPAEPRFRPPLRRLQAAGVKPGSRERARRRHFRRRPRGEARRAGPGLTRLQGAEEARRGPRDAAPLLQDVAQDGAHAAATATAARARPLQAAAPAPQGARQPVLPHGCPRPAAAPGPGRRCGAPPPPPGTPPPAGCRRSAGPGGSTGRGEAAALWARPGRARGPLQCSAEQSRDGAGGRAGARCSRPPAQHHRQRSQAAVPPPAAARPPLKRGGWTLRLQSSTQLLLPSRHA